MSALRSAKRSPELGPVRSLSESAFDLLRFPLAADPSFSRTPQLEPRTRSRRTPGSEAQSKIQNRKSKIEKRIGCKFFGHAFRNSEP